ncbi:MAG: hypothetical protein JWR02_2873 [Mucilaginibacter sp.]|nr:hypothetical protein [Mucilaginibacter sp.]
MLFRRNRIVIAWNNYQINAITGNFCNYYVIVENKLETILIEV